MTNWKQGYGLTTFMDSFRQVPRCMTISEQRVEGGFKVQKESFKLRCKTVGRLDFKLDLWTAD